VVAVDDGDGAFDFRTARAIGDVFIDHAFTGLVRDENGLATVRVRDRSGGGVAISWDSACPWVQVHTADQPDPAKSRLGLAVEPMTCAPDAYNSGLGLVQLAAGGSHRASWRIAALKEDE
jgi:aldose 1-epimerase